MASSAPPPLAPAPAPAPQLQQQNNHVAPPVAAPAATTAKQQVDIADLVRKRDHFVSTMTYLAGAANEAARAGLAYFQTVTTTLELGDITPMTGGLPPQFQQQITELPLAFARAGHFVQDPHTQAISMRHQSEEHEEGGRKRKRKEKKYKDPNAPKRPISSFLMFVAQGKEIVKKDMSGSEKREVPYKEVMQELQRRWAAMEEGEKKVWNDAYAIENEDFKRRKAEYEVLHPKPVKETRTPLTGTLPAFAASGYPSPMVPGTGFTAVNHSKPPSTEDGEEEREHEHEHEHDDESMGDAESRSEGAASPDVSAESSLTPPPVKRKPGRPKKVQPTTPATAPLSAVPNYAMPIQQYTVTPPVDTPDGPPKKKRGRKSKAEKEAIEREAALKRERDEAEKTARVAAGEDATAIDEEFAERDAPKKKSRKRAKAEA